MFSRERFLLFFSTENWRWPVILGSGNVGYPKDEQKRILEVGRLPTTTVNELRSAKMDERHAHLNSLLEE